MKKLATTYTSNQTGAIATGLAGALFALGAIGVAYIFEIPNLLPWVILNIIAWINLLFLVKLVRPAFLVGIAIWIIWYVGYAATVTTPWWAFNYPVYNFAYLVTWLFGLASIYFAYKSYMELKK